MSSAPYLAGQSANYLAAALKEWQNHLRVGAGGPMTTVAERLTDTDVAAVAAYFSTLPPRGGKRIAAVTGTAADGNR